MTTVDAGISGPNGSIDLSNGLLGPATTLLSAAYGLVQEGRARGTAGAAGCDVRLQGSEILRVLGYHPNHVHQKYSSPPSEVERFIATIDPDAEYHLSAIEV